MYLVALGIIVLIRSIVPVGTILMTIVPHGLLKGPMGAFFWHLIVISVSYFLLAAVVYYIFRSLRWEERYSFDGKGRGQLLAGVVIFFSYLFLRALASTIEGGGGSYVLALWSWVFIFPAWALIGIGLFRLWRHQKTGDAT